MATESSTVNSLSQHVIGLDIGGANLKVAHSDGHCRSRAFPLWKHPDQLAAALRELVADWLPCRAIAVTMTGELADCFATKAEGVDRILQAVESVAETSEILVWQTAGEFVPVDVAREFWMLTAAANWHALAMFVARAVPSDGALLIDIGSTTTDIIPIEQGYPQPTGRTDGERLVSGELVYSGVKRTPLCTLASEVGFRGGKIRLAAELFATTWDLYLLRGDLPEESENCETANGRLATREGAHDRVARMLCCDRTEVSEDETMAIANELVAIQQARIATAIDQVLGVQQSPCRTVLISGAGSFLAEQIVNQHRPLARCEQIKLASLFSPEVADAACAFAVAKLAAEQA